MDRRELLIRARVNSETIDLWLDAGWLAPLGTRGEWTFTEIDLARARLINDLAGDLGVNDEGVPIILGLIDQLHGLRRAFGDLLVTLGAQPANVRERFAAELRAVGLERERYATREGSESP